MKYIQRKGESTDVVYCRFIAICSNFCFIGDVSIPRCFYCVQKKREKPGLLTMIAEYTLIGWFVVFVYVTQLMPFGNGMGESFNIKPLHMFYIAFRYGSKNAGMVWQFLLNILMFVPLGFLLPVVFPKKCASWPRVLLFSFCTTFATELVQLFTKRGTDMNPAMNIIGLR